MPPMKGSEKKRLTVIDWEEAALEVIAEQGVDALAVEPLARKLGVTKGSFYWHFGSRDELLYSALKHWLDEESRMVEQIRAIENPRQRLIDLFRLAAQEHPSHKLLSALFQAQGDETIAHLLEQISAQRLASLSEAFAQLGMSQEEAHHRSLLAYTAYVGFLQLVRKSHGVKMTPEDFEQYINHMIDTLIPSHTPPSGE